MLTIMVALHCEAKPIIDAYRLKKNASKPFDHYVDNAGQVELVVSGIGALSMATAVGWIGACRTNIESGQQRIWLNVGTAGHASREVGDILMVHGAGDEIQQRCHYPSMVAKWPGETDAVLSVSVPNDQYPGGAAVDMEAYAYFNSALRFSDSELVQSLKVVSDNQEFGFELLNAAKLTELVANNLTSIQHFIEQLQIIKPVGIAVDYDFDSLFELRGSHSQRLQIRELVQKLQVMGGLADIELEVAKCNNLTEVIKLCRQKLDLLIPSLPASNLSSVSSALPLKG